MKFIPLSDLTTAKWGYTHRVSLDLSDFAGVAALTKIYDVAPDGLGKFPVNTLISDATMIVEQVIVGAATVTLTFGTETAAEAFLAAADCNPKQTAAGLTKTAPLILQGASKLRIAITTTVQNISAITQGKVHVCFRALYLPELAEI